MSLANFSYVLLGTHSVFCSFVRVVWTCFLSSTLVFVGYHSRDWFCYAVFGKGCPPFHPYTSIVIFINQFFRGRFEFLTFIGRPIKLPINYLANLGHGFSFGVHNFALTPQECTSFLCEDLVGVFFFYESFSIGKAFGLHCSKKVTSNLNQVLLMEKTINRC